MLRIGLTGGIGCGKTTVTDLFIQYGIPVSDADLIAHQLVEPGKPAHQKIIESFGTNILNEDQTLDRAALRQLVFDNPQKKQHLEEIIHPLVYVTMNQWAEKQNSPYVIFSIPLLIETNHQHDVDRVLVIDAPEAIQIERVQKRNDLSVEEIRKIISTQVSRHERQRAADDLISNEDDIEQLKKQVSKLHNFYLTLPKNL